MKTLRESIKGDDVDSFHCQLDQLERIVQKERMKGLLKEDGTLCYAAHVGSYPMVNALIQKGAGKGCILLGLINLKLQNK